jgi:NADH dehydrogenase [ubiquinone] 1 alpha subcomplex assembly factor 7
MAMACLAQYPVSPGALAHKFDGAHLFAGHEGALVPAKQQPRSAQRKELEDLQARLDASRQREAELEDARAAAEAELEDARRTAADARAVLESELEQEHAALEEERKRTTELEGRLAFLELEVESSSARGSDTAVRLEERVRALERELSDVAAEAERVRTEAEVEAEAWAAERARFEQEEKRWAQVADGIESERARWEQEREELSCAGEGPGRSRGGRPARTRAALRRPALLARVGSRRARRRSTTAPREADAERRGV